MDNRVVCNVKGAWASFSLQLSPKKDVKVSLPNSKDSQNFPFEKDLKDLFRSATLKRLISAISRKQEISIKEIENKDDFLYGQWMSLILLSGPALQVTLKTHYFNRDAAQLVAWGLDQDVSRVKTSMVMDFMREFLNLASGEVKAVLASANIPVGLSLPLITRGFDEVLFSDNLVERNIQDWWCLAGDFGKLVCTCEIEVFQPDAIKDITPVDMSLADKEDEGNIDFL